MITKRNLLRLLERECERHASIESRLINQLLHVTGNTWTPPPTVEREPVSVEPPVEFTATPEQFV